MVKERMDLLELLRKGGNGRRRGLPTGGSESAGRGDHGCRDVMRGSVLSMENGALSG